MTNHPTIEANARSATRDYLDANELQDAIDLASDQDRSTVITEEGQPIAAIVPIDVLNYYDEMVSNLSKQR